MHSARTWAVLLTGVFGVACATVGPSRWEHRHELQHTRFVAKRFEMFGAVPRTFVSPDGEVRFSLQSWTILGPMTPGFRFSLRAPHSGAVLSCQMYVEDDGSKLGRRAQGALFGCAAPNREVLLRFAPGCRYPGGLLSARCTTGTVQIGDRHLRFEQGRHKATGAAIGHISVTDEEQRLVMAANTVVDMAIELWIRPARHDGFEPIDREYLQLLAIAFHQFSHLAT